jgi:hypothetical protein
MGAMRQLLWGRTLSAVLLLTGACGTAVGAPSPPPPAPPPVTAAPAPSPAPTTVPQHAGTPAASRDADPVPAPAPARQLRAATVPDDPTVQPVAAEGPRRLARQILATERVIRNPRSTENQLAVAGHTQQVAYRAWSQKPRYDAVALPALPRSLRPIARRNLTAHRELASLSGTKPPKTLPEWRIVRPAPRQELKRYYRKAQRIFGVRWQYLAAINLVETRMGRIRGVSTAGAQGPMQFIQPTWDIYGRGDIRDPHDAIMAAARYLRARGAPGDMGRALYSYNNDVRYVRAVAAHAKAMMYEPRTYRAYYHWQVYYRQPGGAVWLPVGYDGRS